MFAPVKDQLLAARPEPSHHQLALSLCDPYRALGEPSGDHRREVCTPLALLGFKISKSSDRFASHIDTDVLRCSVCVADSATPPVLRMRSRSRRAVSAVSASSSPGASICAP